jgi:hypothetical protein
VRAVGKQASGQSGAATETVGEIAGIDTVLAEAAYTSALTALTLGGDEDTTPEDHWAAASPDIKGKMIAELMDVGCIPPRGERGASTPT